MEYAPEPKLNLPETKIVSGQGVMETTEFGAKRESNEGRGRFDLLPYEAIEALAKWFEAGAGKYEERNWEKGISVKDCINRMIRHALKAGNGWTDEDHLAAVMWNAGVAITMMKRKPECNDHVWHYQDAPEFLNKELNIPKEIAPISSEYIVDQIQESNLGLILSPGQIKLIGQTVDECNKVR